MTDATMSAALPSSEQSSQRRPTHRLRPTPSSSSSSLRASTSTPLRSPTFAPSPSPLPPSHSSRPVPARVSSGLSSRPSYGPGVNASSYSYAYSSPSHHPGAPSSLGRDAYPHFLSVWETLLLHAQWGGRGLWDACRWDLVLRTVLQEPEIRMNVLKSLLLNGLSLISIFTFDLLLLPLLPTDHSATLWSPRHLGALYQVLWLWPVVGASLWFNSIYSTSIARRAFLLSHGQPSSSTSPSLPSSSSGGYGGMLHSLATSAYRAIFLLSYLVLQMGLGYVPYAGKPLGFIWTCWVNSYYSHELPLLSRGLSLPERITSLETRWSYHLAFGLPSAALCMWGSSLANAALYAMVFPAFVLMAVHARPVPRWPYAPITAPAGGGEGDAGRGALMSPFIPIRIPIFTPVLVVNELVVRVLSLGTGGSGRRVGGGTAAAGKGWEAGRMERTEEGGEGELEMRPRRKLD